MRYSELAGKEIVDISEGVRLGVITSSDLVIDTDTGTLTAMVVYQKAGFFSSREFAFSWSGVKKVGRDLVIVDMSEADIPVPTQFERRRRERSVLESFTDIPPSDTSDESMLFSSSASDITSDNRTPKHRVAGVDHESRYYTPNSVDALTELQAPDLALGRLVRGMDHHRGPIWHRRRKNGVD